MTKRAPVLGARATATFRNADDPGLNTPKSQNPQDGPADGPAGRDPEAVRIALSGTPEPYRERQRAFQMGKGGAPITYSYKVGSTRQYQQWLRQAAMDAMNGRPPFEQAVRLTMTAFMPIPASMRKADRRLAERELLPHTKRPDTTQLLKAAEDAFAAVVWRDDSLVAEHRLAKRYSPRPRLEIEVRPVRISWERAP